MTVSSTTSVYQNPNYFGGTSPTAMALTSSGSITAASLFDKKYLERKDDYKQQKEAFEISSAGRDAAIKTKISNIVSYIEDGKEDKALKAYQELISEMSKQDRYGQLTTDGDDTQLRAVARSIIESSTGQNLEEIIRENTRDAADVENQKYRSWGNCDTTTQEDLLRELCDIDEEAGSTNPLMAGLNILISPFVVLGNTLFNGGKKM